MSFIAKRQLSTLIPPKIASAKVSFIILGLLMEMDVEKTVGYKRTQESRVVGN